LGAFLPLLSKIVLFPLKNFVWMASLVFDIKPRIYRGAKRHGLYTFSEITEYHLGLIAASGVVINLILAIVGYFVGFPLFARLNIYYAFFSILPLSELDGNKIFFGSKILWSFLASLVLIGMLFAIFII
jgi:Zn-dependent protease